MSSRRPKEEEPRREAEPAQEQRVPTRQEEGGRRPYEIILEYNLNKKSFNVDTLDLAKYSTGIPSNKSYRNHFVDKLYQNSSVHVYYDPRIQTEAKDYPKDYPKDYAQDGKKDTGSAFRNIYNFERGHDRMDFSRRPNYQYRQPPSYPAQRAARPQNRYDYGGYQEYQKFGAGDRGRRNSPPRRNEQRTAHQLESRRFHSPSLY